MTYIGDYQEIISIFIMILLYMWIYIIVVQKIKPNSTLNFIIFVSIIVRIILTLVDTYFMYLPHSGMDSITFELTGYKLMANLIDYSSYSWDNYPRFIFVFYSLFGRKPLLIRVLNGLASVISGLYIYKSIFLISNSKKLASKGMAFFLLFPHSLIFSSIILRESFIVLFCTLSVYNFIKYAKINVTSNLVYSLIYITIGSILHSAIIFVSAGYIYYICRYRKASLLKKFSNYLILGAVLMIVILNKDIFLRKFGGIASLNDLFNRLNRVVPDHVGSAYLRGYTVSSLSDVILFIPLKIIYFLFSPMLWDIRGLQDIIAIALDSVFYIVLVLKIIKKVIFKNKMNTQSLLINALIISTIAVSAVYALGTVASGTALRHRYKILNLMLIMVFSQKHKLTPKETLNN